MPKIKVTAEDLNSFLTMEAGWKKGTVRAVEHKPSKSRDSMNYEITWEVENSPGDMRKLSTFISDKNKPMFYKGITDHYEALYDTHIEPDTEVEPEQWIGLQCWVEISKSLYNNRAVNNIVGFSPNSKVPF